MTVSVVCSTDACLGGSGNSFILKIDDKVSESAELVLLPPKAFLIAWQQDVLAEEGGHKALETLKDYINNPANWSSDMFRYIEPALKDIHAFDLSYREDIRCSFMKNAGYQPADIGGINGTIGFINGRHRTRLLYECQPDKMPVYIENSNKDAVLARVLHTDRLLTQGEPILVSPYLSNKKMFSEVERSIELFKQQKMRAPVDIFLDTLTVQLTMAQQNGNFQR